MESHRRSVLKALSWRFIASLTTVVIVFFFTRELTLSLGIGALEIVSKMILYYGHERLWNHVHWGIK